MGKPAWGCIIFPRLNKNRNVVCIERHYICYYEGGGQNFGLCVFPYSALLKAREAKQSYYRTGFHLVKASRFQDNRHTKLVRLSALRTGRL